MKLFRFECGCIGLEDETVLQYCDGDADVRTLCPRGVSPRTDPPPQELRDDEVQDFFGRVHLICWQAEEYRRLRSILRSLVRD